MGTANQEVECVECGHRVEGYGDVCSGCEFGEPDEDTPERLAEIVALNERLAARKARRIAERAANR